MLTLNTIRSLGGFPRVGGQIAYQPFSTLHGSLAPRRTVHSASWKLYDTT